MFSIRSRGVTLKLKSLLLKVASPLKPESHSARSRLSFQGFSQRLR